MKLLIHLENVKQLEKEGWKKDEGKFSGSQGETSKWTKETDGVKETIFNKRNKAKISSVPHEQFETTDRLILLLSELSARDIVEAVNKAGKTYGYPTTIFPIPLDAKWSIEYDAKEKMLDVNFSSSSFNSGKNGFKLPEKTYEKDNLIARKVHPINILIGNADDHRGNRVYHDKKASFYSIDFGLAFNRQYVRNKEHTINDAIYTVEFMLQKAKNDVQKTRIKKKLADFYNFLEMFVEHNETFMLNVLDKNYKAIGKKIASEAKDVDEDTENNIMHSLSMLEKAKDEKQKVVKETTKLILEMCNKVQGILK